MDYEYFSKHYKLIATDLSKQIELENSDIRQQINFIGKLEDCKATMFLILRNQKKRHLLFYKILVNLLNDSSNEESKFPTKK